MSSADTALQEPRTRGLRELRLALVLYGGVSLAIYMHGITKELHRLVRASVPDEDDPGALGPSERVYRGVLEAKAQQDGNVRTRVVIDAIAGTSAGGINGVYLAKALAHDLPQDELREVWLRRGDLSQLVRGPKWMPWQARMAFVLPTLWRKPALDGDRMSGWLYQALAGMDAGGNKADRRSLMPPGHRLDLFVTTTDFYGYDRELLIEDPPQIYDRRHRHVLEFVYGDGRDDFRAEPLDNAALAYAARSTSCFPGAFPPVSFASFERDLEHTAQVDVRLAALEERLLFRHYGLSGAKAGDAHFVDGGVLDNRPFGHVIGAIRERPATVQVDRRLLYLEPDPGEGPAAKPGPRPNPIATVLASVAGIPRREPILDDILDLTAQNERVRQVRDVIESSWSSVTKQVAAVLGSEDLTALPPDADDPRLQRWRSDMERDAVDRAGLSYLTYVRTKIGSVVDGLAAMVCASLRFPDDCNQASFARVALREHARRRGLFRPAEDGQPSSDQIAFLRDLDLGYAERRLRFVIAGLSWWYDSDREQDFAVPDRPRLDAAKQRLYEAVEALRAAMRGDGLPGEVFQAMERCFSERVLSDYLGVQVLGKAGLDRYLEAVGAQLDAFEGAVRAHYTQRFNRFSAGLYEQMQDLTADWDPEARKRLLVRYLGFPYWDTMLFPVQLLSGVGERDHVEVMRMSPEEATLIGEGAGRLKLKGIHKHHFGAFFGRAARENDYLWGRLDAAERLIGLLLGRRHPDYERWCHQAFAAVLDEESDLELAADLVAEVRTAIRSQRGA